MVKCQEISFAVSHYCKHHQYPHQTQASRIIQLLLILSGSVEINPGLRAPRFPCGECHKAVSIDPSIACDNCHQCFHESCINMNTIIFETYQDNTSIKWLCCSCGLAMLQSNYLRQQIHQYFQFLPSVNIQFALRQKVYAY